MIDSALKGTHETLKAEVLNLFLKTAGIKLFNTRTVKELISGYVDPLMTMAKLAGYADTDVFSLLNGVSFNIY